MSVLTWQEANNSSGPGQEFLFFSPFSFFGGTESLALA
jgi:hypothetical protein